MALGTLRELFWKLSNGQMRRSRYAKQLTPARL